MRIGLRLDLRDEGKQQVARQILASACSDAFFHSLFVRLHKPWSTHAPLHADIPWNLAWFWVLLRSQEGFFDKEKVSGGRFQGFWNLLIRHHYIKIILIKWGAHPLCAHAGNQQ